MVLVYLLRLTFKEFSRKMNSLLSSLTGFSSIESGFIFPASYQVFLSKTGYMTSCALQKKTIVPSTEATELDKLHVFLRLVRNACFSRLCHSLHVSRHSHVACFTTLGTMVCFPALRICCIFSRPLHQLLVFPRKRPLCSRLHNINIFLLGRTTNNLPRPHFFFCSLGS